MDSQDIALSKLKNFCSGFVQCIGVDKKLPILVIPKVISDPIDEDSDHNNTETVRKLQCIDTAKCFAEQLAVTAVIAETVLSI
jgi:hypothetical protein